MAAPRQRLRITFVKDDPIRFSSHLDLARVWARGLRRAGVPLAYSQGFNPRPRIQLAAALALGHTAEAELLDAWLERQIATAGLCPVLARALPVGLAVTNVSEVRLAEPPLQTRVASAEYLATVEWDESERALDARIAAVLSAAELPATRRGKRYNLRPLIERLWLERVHPGQVVLGMLLAACPGRTARPESVVEALGMAGSFTRYHRRRLILAAN